MNSEITSLRKECLIKAVDKVMQKAVRDLKCAILHQHKSLTKAVDTCNADKFVKQLNRINTKTMLVNLKRIENLLFFRKEIENEYLEKI